MDRRPQKLMDNQHRLTISGYRGPVDQRAIFSNRSDNAELLLLVAVINQSLGAASLEMKTHRKDASVFDLSLQPEEQSRYRLR